MKHSSIIVLTRGQGDDLEVFWSQRQFDMAFLGGFWAFAGGSVEDDDDEVPLSQSPPAGFPSREHLVVRRANFSKSWACWSATTPYGT